MSLPMALTFGHTHKTGALLERSRWFPWGYLAGSDGYGSSEHCSTLLQNIGLAFQIVDDIPRYYGNPRRNLGQNSKCGSKDLLFSKGNLS
jgi:geranylgeranyl pyrophosphate synthase